MEPVIDWMTRWSEGNPQVEALVAFGSFARGDETRSSDFDACVIGAGDMEKLQQEFVRALKTTFKDALCYMNEEPGQRKVFALFRPKQEQDPFSVLRVDCYIVDSFNYVGKFVVGSELSLSNMHNILLFDRQERESMGRAPSPHRQWLLDHLSGRASVKAEAVTQAHRFIEAFEVSSHKRANSDKFQAYFQMFICYLALVKLEFIRHGGINFLYLPKQVFNTFPNAIRRHFEDVLEPRGLLSISHSLLQKYKNQFIDTLSALLDLDIVSLEDISVNSVHAVGAMLEAVLERDRLYNFRDVSTVAADRMQLNRVFRGGCHTVDEGVKRHHIASIVDLRDAAEIEGSGEYKIPAGVQYVNIDLVGSSQIPELPSASASYPDKDVPKVETMYSTLITAGRGAVGIALRALTIMPLPTLVHCVAGRDRTGIVVALLQLLCGATQEQVLKDYLASGQGVKAENLEYVLDLVTSEGICVFLLSCGLDSSEIERLHKRFSLSPADGRQVPFHTPIVAAFKFDPQPPRVGCRAFLKSELESMRELMLLDKPRQQAHPAMVLITGLPGSGKSTAIKAVLEKLGMKMEDCVCLDMDLIRSFHAQFQTVRCQLLAHGDAAASHQPVCWLKSHREIISWFIQGNPTLERDVYSTPIGIVQTLLRDRCNFVLPSVVDSPRTLNFMKHCVELYGYTPHVACVHVEERTAQERVSMRAEKTGRWTPRSLIDNRSASIRQCFALTAEYICALSAEGQLAHGSVTLLNNEGAALDEALHVVGDSQTISNPELALQYCPLILPSLSSEQKSPVGVVLNSFDTSRAALPPARLEYSMVPRELNRAPPNPIDASADDGECDSNMIAGAGIHDQYLEDGFVSLRGCLDAEIVGQLGQQFEDGLSTFARDNGLSPDRYLSVVNKWSDGNVEVKRCMDVIAAALHKDVARVLGATTATAVAAVIFRKSSNTEEASCCRTHVHQDIAYARFKGSQLFRATTWVPLVLRNADTLAFARGSHKAGIGTVADFLRAETESITTTCSIRCDHSAPIPIPECRDEVQVRIGDCIVFDARTWHCSTPVRHSFPTGPSSSSLRLAIGIQWRTPGGLDGLKPGTYFRWPDSDVPPLVDLQSMRRQGIFGMDTAGWFLKCALICVLAEAHASLDQDEITAGAASVMASLAHDQNRKKSGHEEAGGTSMRVKMFTGLNDAVLLNQCSTQRMARWMVDSARVPSIVDLLTRLGCDSELVRESLSRYLLLRQAGRRHFGECQGTKVFPPLFQALIKPVLYTNSDVAPTRG